MPPERRASHAVPPPKKVKRPKREQAPPHDPSLQAHPPPKHRSFGTPPASRDKYAKTRATSPLVGPSAPLAPLARPRPVSLEPRQPPMIRPSPPSPLRQSRATPSAPFLDTLLLGQRRGTRVGHAREAATRLAAAQQAADAHIARVEPASWPIAEARAAKFPYPPGWGAAGYQAPREAIEAWERKTGIDYDAWVKHNTRYAGPSAREMEARDLGMSVEDLDHLDAMRRKNLGFFGEMLNDPAPGLRAISKGYFTPQTLVTGAVDVAGLTALPGIGLVGRGVTSGVERGALGLKAGLKAEGDVVRRGIVKHYKDIGYTRAARRKIRGGADVVARAADRRAGGSGDTLAGYGGRFADVRSHLDSEGLLGDGVMTQVKPLHRIAREKWLKNLRAKVNPRWAEAGKPPNPPTKTTAGHHIAGEITPQDWVARILHVFGSPEEIEDAARWYETFEPLFRKHFGRNADRVMRAFAVSQANASPSGGLASVLRAMHKIDRGEEVGSIGSVVADSIEAALKGEMVDKKMAAKLSDFTDALRGKKRRTWMGNRAAGGAPAPVDVWGLRDLGYIDKGLLSRRGGQLKGGELNRARQIEADHGVDLTKLTHTPGTAEGSRYERAAEKYQEITDHLNEIGFNGRSDWTPAQTQALGWSGIQRFFGNVPEDLVTAIEKGKTGAERGIRVTPIKKYEALVRKAAREQFGVRKPTLEQQLKAEDVLHEQMARRSDDPEARKFLALYDDAVYARKLAEGDSGKLFQSAPGEFRDFRLSRLPEESEADYAARRERARELLYRDLRQALNPDALPEGWHGQRRTLVDPGGRLAPASEASFPARPFYSPLYRAVAQMPAKFSPQELLGRLEKLGVKKDEVESSALNTFLADQKSVTKEEVLGWLDSSYLKIEENERFRPRNDLLAGTGLLPVEDIDSDLTKFGGEYMLAGGPESNPREITIRLPESEHGLLFSYTGHFPDPNILAHIRFSERTVDGKRTLMIEEIQSDWHQAGQKRGYKRPIQEHPDFAARTQHLQETQARLDQAMTKEDGTREYGIYNSQDARTSEARLRNVLETMEYTSFTVGPHPAREGFYAVYRVYPRSEKQIVDSFSTLAEATARKATAERELAEAAEAIPAAIERQNQIKRAFIDQEHAASELRALEQDVNRGVENAPFKKTWHELALKRMLAYAVEHGYERVAWTTGEQQAKRYNLANFFQRLEVEPKHAPEVGDEEYEDALQNAWDAHSSGIEFDPRIQHPHEEDFVDPETEQFDESAYEAAIDDWHQQYDDARDEMEAEARAEFESDFEYQWENEHQDEGGYTIHGWRHGDTHPTVEEDVPDDSLADYVGPDLAERIYGGETSFEGDNLAMGSNAKSAIGASLFYDRKLRSFADKYLKKFKVKVEPRKIENQRPWVDPYEGATFHVAENPDRNGEWHVWAKFPDSPLQEAPRRIGNQESRQEAERLAAEWRGGYRPGAPPDRMVTEPPHGETVHSVEITPQVKEFVEGGQPLFQSAPNDPHTKRAGKLLGDATAAVDNLQGEAGSYAVEGIHRFLAEGDYDSALGVIKALPRGPKLDAAGRAIEKLIQHGKSRGRAPSMPPDWVAPGSTGAGDFEAEALRGMDVPTTPHPLGPQYQSTGSYRGAVQPSGDGRYILHLFANADASTVIHEMGHAIKRLLSPEDIATLAKHGLNDEETFARTFEAYFRNGEAPTMALRKVFRTMSQLLRGVYADVREIGETNLNPDTKAVFDHFMTKGGTSKRPPPLALVEGALFQPRRRQGIPGEGQMNLFGPSPGAAAAVPPPPVHPLLDPAAGPPPPPGAAVPPPAAGGPPQLPPSPPPTAAGAAPTPPPMTVEEAGAEVMGGMGQAERLTREQTKLRKIENGYRTREYQRRLAAGYSEEAARAALKGPMPTFKWDRFTSIDNDLLAQMMLYIRKHPKLQAPNKVYTAIRTEDALRRIVEGGLLPRPFERKLLRDVFGGDTDDIIDSISNWKKVGRFALDLWSLPRTLLSTLDLSFPLRQGLGLAVSHPVIWGKQFWPMLKSYGNTGVFEDIQRGIAEDPNFDLMERAGIPFTELGAHAVKAEEAFPSSLAERIPYAGAPVKASNRAYVAFGNKSRQDYFNWLIDNVRRAYPELDLESPDADKLLQDLGRIVGNATGRGRVKNEALARAMPVLNQTLFSPRLLKSRLDVISYPATMWHLDKVARREAYRQLGGIVALASGVTTLTALAGGKVTKDPRNADWGKVRVGNKRFDLLGGYQQPFRLMAQLATGTVINSVTGEKLSLGTSKFGAKNRLSVLGRFTETKLAPPPGFLIDLLRGTDFERKPFSMKSELEKRLTPLLLQDAYDASKEGDDFSSKLALALAIYGIGVFGVGTQVYGPPLGGPKPNVPVGGGSDGLFSDSGGGLFDDSGGGLFPP